MQLTEQNPLIPSDKYIILVDNRNEQRLLKLCAHKQRKFNWRKTLINLQQLKQQPFYQLLQVGNNSLKPIDFANPDDQSDVQENDQENDGQVKQNNKEMYTLEDAQKLQTQDIQKLKKQKTPQQLIKQITENNQQFQKRTAYSKAKYLKKKQKKYSFILQPHRYIFNFHAEPVSLQNLHDYYFKNQLKMIGGIRWDMLGLFLLHAGPFNKVLIGQRTKGIVLGSALVKGAKEVTFVAFEQKSMKHFPIVEQLNIDWQKTKSVTFHTWQSLKTIQKRPSQHDSFLLLGNYDFTSMVNTAQQLSLLSSQTSIAFFCLSLEPILECFSHIRKNHKNYLNVRIYDSWCREYQVLKNRTHPLMYMDSRPGYLLTAVRVDKR